MFILLFLIEFACVFFLSRNLSKHISKLLLTIIRSEKITIYFLSILFLPGVIIHELAHWLMANILFVKTGEIEFLPVVHGNTVKLGSVAIAKTDPIRRFLIGIAPILFGLLVIFSVYTFFFQNISFTFSWKEATLFYLLFEIGNTMYSSGKDMEGAIGFFILAGILVAISLFFYFFLKLHFPISIIHAVTAQLLQQIFQKMDILLGLLIVIDVIIAGSISLMLRK